MSIIFILFQSSSCLSDREEEDLYDYAAKYEGGRSIIVGPKLEILAQDPTTDKEGIIEAEIPIAEFRRNRKIPNYALELVEPVFSQYKQEIPINHLDMPDDQLPATGAAMKKLFDRISRYMGKTLPE